MKPRLYPLNSTDRENFGFLKIQDGGRPSYLKNEKNSHILPWNDTWII